MVGKMKAVLTGVVISSRLCHARYSVASVIGQKPEKH